MLYGATPNPLAQLAATASTRSTPLWRSNTTGSPVSASTATMSIGCRGQSWLGSRAATVARHWACPEPSDAASSSSAAAPILRRMSAASSAAPMISLVISMWFATGTFETRPRSAPTRPVRGWGAARMLASSSVGGVPLVIWAATVDPADVPMMRSASVTSSPTSERPAMTPISHAFPADPPPWRTNARSPAACAGEVKRRDEEGVVFKRVAFRELRVGRSRWRLRQSRHPGLIGSTHCGHSVHGSHLLSMEYVAFILILR